MKLAKCEKGHYFDNDIYPSCPICNSALLKTCASDIVKCKKGHSYNKGIYTHCPFCSISVDNNGKLYVGDYSYTRGEKILYLGVGELGCKLLNGIEKHLDNGQSVFHYYDYNQDTFRYIYSDNCTLLSRPSILDFSDITDKELSDINKLYSRRFPTGPIPRIAEKALDSIFTGVEQLFLDPSPKYDYPFRFEFLDLGSDYLLFRKPGSETEPLFMDLVIFVSAFNSTDFHIALTLEHQLVNDGASNNCFVNTIIAALSDEYKTVDDSVPRQENHKRCTRESIIEYELSTWVCDGEDAKYLFVLPYRTKDELILYFPHELGVLKSINCAHNFFVDAENTPEPKKDPALMLEEILMRIKIVEDKSSDIQEKVFRVDERTKEMKVLLDRIADIQREIKSERGVFQSCLNDDESTEPVYKQFVDTIADTICQKLYHGDDSKVAFEENILRGIFGDYWESLDEYTRKSLVSARVFLTGNTSLSNETLDYSGVVISATSALEKELKLRFFDGYKAYLRNRFKRDFSKWPKSMTINGKAENSLFTIGSLPAIFGNRQRDYNGNRFYNQKMIVTPAEKALLNDYLKTILYYSNDDIDTFFRPDIHGLSFLDLCEDIRCLYRNNAAHTDSMTMEEATACCRDVIGTNRNDAAQNVRQVEGLILRLVRISKNPTAT